MRKPVLHWSIAVLLLMAACSRSEKGESKRWDSGNRAVDELVVLYPGFKTALEEQRQKAKAAWDAAGAASDEKQRIDKMAAANALLSSGFIGQLRDVDQQTKQIRQKIVDVTAQAQDEATRLSAKQASEGAEQALAEVSALLKQGASDAAAAAVVLKKVTGDLRAAQDNLDRVAAAVRDKQKPAQGTGSAQPAGGQAAGQGQEAAQAWACEYCNASNEAGATTCSNCGAARPHGHTDKK